MTAVSTQETAMAIWGKGQGRDLGQVEDLGQGEVEGQGKEKRKGKDAQQ